MKLHLVAFVLATCACAPWQVSALRTRINQRPVVQIAGHQEQLLATTGYWQIPSKRGDSNQSDAVYSQCMTKIMTLDCPLAIYGSPDTLKEMQRARGTVAPPLQASEVVSVNQLGPCAAHQDFWMHARKYTNKYDVPSVELGCIWDGKPGLLARSAHQHSGYKWHAWVDVCMGHGVIPFPHGLSAWPSSQRLHELPDDMVTVSYSGQNNCEDCRDGWTYCHCIAGTAFVVPDAMVEDFASNFSQKVDACLATFDQKNIGAYVCLSDQVILTKLMLDNPELFFFSSFGYGAVATSFLTDPGMPDAFMRF